MARPEKIEKVESLRQVFTEARSVVLNDFTGLNVEKLSELRKKCRESNVEYLVVKNTLAKRSVDGTPAADLESYLEGPTAIAISNESENISAKIIAEFANEHEAPVFKAAIVEGKVIDATEVLALSKLPSREQLLSQLLGSIKSPAQGLVSVLQATARSLVYALNAISEKKQSEGEVVEAPAADSAAPEPADAGSAEDTAPADKAEAAPEATEEASKEETENKEEKTEEPDNPKE